MIKNIVFDFGAVLIDWNPRHLYRGFFNDDERMERFLSEVCNLDWNIQMDAGRPFAETIPERVALFPEWEDAIRIYETRWQEMIGGEMPGMFELLNRLSAKGIPMYGLTNWSLETFPPVYERYNRIFSQLRGYVISAAEHLTKPDPKIYQTLLQRYHLEAGETLFVDDSLKNVDGALAVGMQAVQYQCAAQLTEWFEKHGIL